MAYMYCFFPDLLADSAHDGAAEGDVIEAVTVHTCP